MKGDIRLPIKFYKQTTPYTCGAACLLMVLNYFNTDKFPLTRQLELKIHRETYYGRYRKVSDEFTKNFRSTTYAGLANFALKNGLKAKLWQQYSVFKFVPLWPKYIFSEFVRIYRIYQREALRNGLNLLISNFNVENLLDEICLGRAVILLVPHDNGKYHNIVLYGFKDKKIYIQDPNSGPLSIETKALDKAINKIKFGKLALSVWL